VTAHENLHPRVVFQELLERVCRRALIEGRPASAEERAEVRAAWEAWVRYIEAFDPEGTSTRTRPPPWRAVEYQLGTVPAWARAGESAAIDRPPADPPLRSTRGRRKGAVLEDEASKAARIYIDHRDEFARRQDGGAYAVHERYARFRKGDPALLSRPMVGHLIRAIEDETLPWNPAANGGKGGLLILDEFWTSPGVFVIPRRKTAS
jgi:hypothetical protein